jgi:hypothetical protein
MDSDPEAYGYMPGTGQAMLAGIDGAMYRDLFAQELRTNVKLEASSPACWIVQIFS